MSLRDKLLAVLATPAAAGASDEDTERRIQQMLGMTPSATMRRPKSIALDFDRTIFAGEFTQADVVDGPPVAGAIEWLREQLATGVDITIHTCRLTPAYPGTYWNQHADQPAVQAAISAWLGQWLSAAELALLAWWTHPGKPGAQLYLDDKGWRFEGVFPKFTDEAALSPPSHTCTECRAWRRRIELDLGDGVEVRGATHTRLRRMLSIAIQELGADLATAQRERDEALTALAELRAQHEHALDVIAQELDAGDLDTLRLRLADYREVARG